MRGERVTVELDLGNPRHRRILREILDGHDEKTAADGGRVSGDVAETGPVTDLTAKKAELALRRIGFRKE